MNYEIIEDTVVLIPNKEHKNFTQSDVVIPKGTVIEGKKINVQGKRRGDDFVYRLFLTNKNEYIHLKKIKPMETTEVKLGADGVTTPTVVSIPAIKKALTPMVVAATLIGGALGYYYANKKGFEKTKKYLYIGGGAVAGFALGKYIEKRKPVVITPSK